VPSGIRYAFGEFELDTQGRRLLRGEEPVALADRHFEVLHQLVAQAGTIVSKDALVAAAWGDVAVTDNSLEQAISVLRRTIGADADARPLIETVPRRGYRFVAAVTRPVQRQSDASLDALLAPHRAWLEGRAALETLERGQIGRAREVFERVLATTPDHPLVHIGLANACAMQFEATRADRPPDTRALTVAAEHAREGCRLEPQSGEAWATLGFVLDRSGHHVDAVAALRRAVSLEPDNWRHHLRLAYASWGEERLRSARRALARLPGCPLAHWLAATVHVARNLLDEAEQELTSGVEVQQRQGQGRFSAVGLHWLRGLVHLARGGDDRAIEDLERELSLESTGHVYARECCANAWYAIGALRWRQQRHADARTAFEQARARIAHHPLAGIALAVLDGSMDSQRALEGGLHGGPTPAVRMDVGPAAVSSIAAADLPMGNPHGVEVSIAHGVAMTLQGDPAGAAQLVEASLSGAPPGNAGWFLPVEPLLQVAGRAAWVPALERLRLRAA
jgi:DNA-binding winged helix-turn-helix (wHTH) protein